MAKHPKEKPKRYDLRSRKKRKAVQVKKTQIIVTMT